MTETEAKPAAQTLTPRQANYALVVFLLTKGIIPPAA